jgi:hypothetical protein
MSKPYIEKIKVFDFDETLFRMPSYASKNSVEEPGKTFDTPYSYYDNEASLNESKYNIQLIDPVYSEWKNGDIDPLTNNILVTHRVEELKNPVLSILEKRNIKFDEYFFLGRKQNKAEVIINLISNYPQLKVIEIYEDSIEQIFNYQERFAHYNYVNRTLDKLDRLVIETFIVDKSKVYMIENVKLFSERKIKLI